MAVLTAALMLVGVAGFLAGKEYDNYVRKINYNRRLRREREEQIRTERLMQWELDEEKRKFDYMYSVQFDAPRR